MIEPIAVVPAATANAISIASQVLPVTLPLCIVISAESGEVGEDICDGWVNIVALYKMQTGASAGRLYCDLAAN